MINATSWTINQATEKTINNLVSMIVNDNVRKFNVIEAGSDYAITVRIDKINETTGEVLYSVICNGKIDYYSDRSVAEFVEFYLVNCKSVAMHWTINN